ncbi:hypothetical protein [Blastopirellula sediminis]|uniref:hypothetical protein n=1 Tax=Blastopirellula sediminis TaxID=2894196 RepID=UPI001E286D09|nr:hypothetical protein [Blastopirellula sediminis]MCC9605053.1 hypothetical protein [Blastopirellula sediminis]
MSRPSNLPNLNRPSIGSNNRPSVNTPSLSRPNLSHPGSSGSNRPNITARPNFDGGRGGLISGGRPTDKSLNDFLGISGNRPGSQRPTTLPGNISSRPGLGNIDRPNIGGGGNRPGLERPTTLPGIIGDRPGTGGGNRPGIERPTTLPGIIGDRPGIGGGGDRPGIGGGDRPGIGGGDRPGIGGGDRPGIGGGDRPGIGGGDRPGIGGGNRPGIGGGNRPGIVDGNRPIRPDRPHGPGHGDHWDNWHNRGNYVRNRYNYWSIHNNWNHGFWGWNNPYYNRWGFYGYRPYAGYWWRWATPVALSSWFYWGPTWGTPCYYDYGSNVYYDTQYVYYNSQPIATTTVYYQQASDFAAAGREALAENPPTEDSGENWMPLGVFALVNKEEGDPIMYLQLAVNKDGIIAGTYYNTETKTNLQVQGSVDKDSQRAAWTIGDKTNTVMETGIYNLTQDETPILIHFGEDKTQTWMLVRLPENQQGQAEGVANPDAVDPFAP